MKMRDKITLLEQKLLNAEQTNGNLRLDDKITDLEYDNKRQLDRIVELERQSTIEESVGNLLRCDIANLNYRLARAQAEAADISSIYWKLRSSIAGWESRTGKDMSKLLKGDFAQPFGTEGPGL